MSSISWVIPSTGLPAYITAKAAIVGLTRTMAHELGAAGIRVNCILPGGILTDFAPFGGSAVLLSAEVATEGRLRP